jgi:hypothetical protein
LIETLKLDKNLNFLMTNEELAEQYYNLVKSFYADKKYPRANADRIKASEPDLVGIFEDQGNLKKLRFTGRLKKDLELLLNLGLEEAQAELQRREESKIANEWYSQGILKNGNVDPY